MPLNRRLGEQNLLGNLAGAFSTGLSDTLSNLAQHKTSRIHEQEMYKTQQSRVHQERSLFKKQAEDAGINPKLAQFLSSMGPKERAELIKAGFKGGLFNFGENEEDLAQAEPQNNKQSLIAQIQELARGGQNQQNAISALQGLQQPKNPQEQLQQALMQRMGIGKQQQAPQGNQFLEQIQQLLQGQQNQKPQTLQGQQDQQPLSNNPVINGQPFQNTPKKLTQAQLIQKGLQNPMEQIARERLEFKKEEGLSKREQHEKEHFDKKYETYNKDLDTRAHSADNAIQEVRSQINILQNGKLNKPAYYAMLKSAKADWPFLLEGDTIALEKGAINLGQKMLKTNFGSRPTDFGFKKTLEAVPNALHNPEDALSLAYRIDANQGAEKALWNARNEVIEDNKGYSPANLPKLVDERAKPQLDSLALQFNYALPPTDIVAPDSVIEAYGKYFSNEENPLLWKEVAKPKEGK